MRLLIGIPALNEEATIADVISNIPPHIAGVTEYDICVIDDGSSDRTAEIAMNAGAHVISNQRSRGLAHGFRQLVRFALVHKSDIFVNIDGDGQFSPLEIPKLLEPIIDGRADFVAANRFGNHHARPTDMPLSKYWGNRIMNRLLERLTGQQFCDVSSGFRAYSRHALMHINLHSSFTYTQESFLDLATKAVAIEQVPVKVTYSKDRHSRVVRNILHYALRTSATILRTVRDHRPLFVFGIPAIVLCIAGFAAAFFTLTHYILTGSFSPFIFVGMTGAYMFSIGLIVGIVGVASDMLRPIRRNQEEMLYLLKRQQYGDSSYSGEE